MGRDLFVKTGEKGTPEMEMSVYECQGKPMPSLNKRRQNWWQRKI